jgi:GNAT acetyltransferase-like protein
MQKQFFFFAPTKRVLEFLDRDPAKSIDDARQWIVMINEAAAGNESIAWAISLKNEANLIGTITFWNIEKEHYRAEIGYALHPRFQGMGLMREAMTVVLDYGFKIMNLHSVEANVNPAIGPRLIFLKEIISYVRPIIKKTIITTENFLTLQFILCLPLHEITISDYDNE